MMLCSILLCSVSASSDESVPHVIDALAKLEKMPNVKYEYCDDGVFGGDASRRALVRVHQVKVFAQPKQKVIVRIGSLLEGRGPIGGDELRNAYYTRPAEACLILYGYASYPFDGTHTVDGRYIFTNTEGNPSVVKGVELVFKQMKIPLVDRSSFKTEPLDPSELIS